MMRKKMNGGDRNMMLLSLLTVAVGGVREGVATTTIHHHDYLQQQQQQQQQQQRYVRHLQSEECYNASIAFLYEKNPTVAALEELEIEERQTMLEACPLPEVYQEVNCTVDLTNQPASQAFKIGCEEAGGDTYYFTSYYSCTSENWNATYSESIINDVLCVDPICTVEDLEDAASNDWEARYYGVWDTFSSIDDFVCNGTTVMSLPIEGSPTSITSSSDDTVAVDEEKKEAEEEETTTTSSASTLHKTIGRTLLLMSVLHTTFCHR